MSLFLPTPESALKILVVMHSGLAPDASHATGQPRQHRRIWAGIRPTVVAAALRPLLAARAAAAD